MRNGFGRSLAALLVVLAGACSSDPVRPERRIGPDGDGGGGTAEENTAPTGGPSCANAMRDGDETDFDCGGATCPACANGRVCKESRDCVSLVCSEGKCTNDAGCSDGSREAFTSMTAFPNIAACAGAWTLPGLVATTVPACGRAAGNGGANPKGTGCNVADLCQAGWHVCATAAEVGEKTAGAGCAGATVAGQNAFFVVRQSGSGGAMCGAGTNDLFGCGDVGVAPDATTCAPLDRFSNDLCTALPATWACGTDGFQEANCVTKTAVENGGVLCCRD